MSMKQKLKAVALALAGFLIGTLAAIILRNPPAWRFGLASVLLGGEMLLFYRAYQVWKR